MDELADAERNDIRAFINNEDSSYLSDLSAFWDAIGPDSPAKVRDGRIFPSVTQRGLMLAQYLVYARTKR